MSFLKPEFVYFEPNVTKQPDCQHTVELALKNVIANQIHPPLGLDPIEQLSFYGKRVIVRPLRTPFPLESGHH